MLSVRCLIIAPCLCGHCARSNNASTRSFLRVMEAGMPHKLRQRFKSSRRLVVINSPSKDISVGREPAKQQKPQACSCMYNSCVYIQIYIMYLFVCVSQMCFCMVFICFAHERAKQHATSHTASQQCIIPVEIAFMRHAAAEAGDINIMLCAQCVKHIIRQCPRIAQIKIAFQNLR